MSRERRWRWTRVALISGLSVTVTTTVMCADGNAAKTLPSRADFPLRPLRFIDANVAGGGTDYLARVIRDANIKTE